MENLNSRLAISFQARANELKENFYSTFLMKCLFSSPNILIPGSHHEAFKTKRCFHIYSYHTKELQKYARDLNIPECSPNDLIQSLYDLDIYYENLSVFEFEDIITSLRDFYYNCGIYIDLEVVEKITSTYFEDNIN